MRVLVILGQVGFFQNWDLGCFPSKIFFAMLLAFLAECADSVV